MIDANVDGFAERFGRYEEVESILYYPHPFTEGGLILVCRDDTGAFLDLAADVYERAPPSLSLHCVRHRELFQLSIPGLFAPPLQVNERPHLPYWLKHKGVILFGTDLRDRVQPLTDPRILLAGHVEGCMDYLRRYGVLASLMHGKQGQLVAMLAQEMRYLMGTALLSHEVWDVSLETLPAHFEKWFPGTRPLQIWQHFQARQARWAETTAGAIDAVWSFEHFLRALREYTE